MARVMVYASEWEPLPIVSWFEHEHGWGWAMADIRSRISIVLQVPAAEIPDENWIDW